MFQPRLNANGRVCCTNPTQLCPDCKRAAGLPITAADVALLAGSRGDYPSYCRHYNEKRIIEFYEQDKSKEHMMMKAAEFTHTIFRASQDRGPRACDATTDPYEEGIRQMRAASGIKTVDTDTLLGRLVDAHMFRRQVLTMASTAARAASEPSISAAHFNPPDPYRAAIEKHRRETY